jgi:Flp pilus assembly protein TadG
MKPMSKPWRQARRSATALIGDRSGLAAIEFAMIVPIMLVMFFGVVEFSSAIAVDRKVTLMARTLSDLTSQSTSVGDSDMSNFFAAGGGIMTPYDSAPIKATITELYVDPTTHQARVQWTKAYQGGPVHQLKDVIPLPSALLVDDTYLIFSEVNYLYTPAVGYVMGKAGVKLSDVAYTRPRQSVCVYYSPAIQCTKL